MAAGADALAGAKAAANSATNFQKSVSKQSGVPLQHASYATAHKARVDSGAAAQKSSGVDKDVSDVVSGIKWRQEQSKAANPDQ